MTEFVNVRPSFANYAEQYSIKMGLAMNAKYHR